MIEIVVANHGLSSARLGHARRACHLNDYEHHFFHALQQNQDSALAAPTTITSTPAPEAPKYTPAPALLPEAPKDTPAPQAPENQPSGNNSNDGNTGNTGKTDKTGSGKICPIKTLPNASFTNGPYIDNVT